MRTAQKLFMVKYKRVVGFCSNLTIPLMNTQTDGCLLFLPGPPVIKMVVKEDSDAVLNCSFTSGSIEQKLFDWKKDGQKEVFMYNKGIIYQIDSTTQDSQFSGRVFHFPTRLKSGDASVVIRSAEVRDSGIYTCLFPLDGHERPYATIELVVGECLHPNECKHAGSSHRRDWSQCPGSAAGPHE